jgi:hypothetical protein
VPGCAIGRNSIGVSGEHLHKGGTPPSQTGVDLVKESRQRPDKGPVSYRLLGAGRAGFARTRSTVEMIDR